MGALKANTRLSTKGQVILPKVLRDRKGWKPGEELVAEDTPQGVLLRPKQLFKPTKLEEVAGCLKRSGAKPLSIEDMDRAIGEGVTERYRRAFDAGD